jgi:hypothetical protein
VATAKTTNEGRSMEGAHAGFPFPMPKDGYEAMWNHLVRFNGQAYESKYRNLSVDRQRPPVADHRRHSIQEYPFWDAANTESDTYWRIKLSYTGPARRAGEALQIVDPIDIGEKDRRAWIYLPGQRRVKIAPDLSHDTPNAGTAGGNTFDDIFIFNGSMDRFDFKLVGKKEMSVPYNAYGAVYQSTQKELLTPNHLNPDLVRWELHRVWVVEATLREGKRHVYSKRTFYLDEDSWAALASDEYDARGPAVPRRLRLHGPSYDVPAPYSDMFGHYDLIARIYSLTGYTAETGGMHQTKPRTIASGPPDACAAAAFAESRTDIGRGRRAIMRRRGSLFLVTRNGHPRGGRCSFGRRRARRARRRRGAQSARAARAVERAGPGRRSRGRGRPARPRAVLRRRRRTWQQAEVPVSSDLVAVSFPSPSAGWAVGHDGVILHTNDSGATWSRQLDGRRTGALLLQAYPDDAQASEPEAAAALHEQAQRFADQGAENPFLDVWFTDEREGYAIGAFGLILHTADAGTTWQPWLHAVDNPGGLHLYSIRNAGEDLYIVGRAGPSAPARPQVRRFERLELPYKGTLFGVIGDARGVVAFGLRGTVLRSADRGASWTRSRPASRSA